MPMNIESAEGLADVKNALIAFGEAVESKNTETAKNVEDFMSKYQDEADKVAKAFAEKEQAAKDAEEKAEKLEVRLKDLEHDVATKGSGSGDPADGREGDEYKNFMRFLQKGDRAQDLDIKTLRTDNDTAGGYLLPSPMDTELRKNIREMSSVRQHARLRTMPGKTLDVPRRLNHINASFEGEAETGEDDESLYGSEQVTAYRQTVTVPVTEDMLISAAVDMEREIVSDVAEAFAVNEATNFVSGTGNKGPAGIITDSRVAINTSATTGVLAFEDFADVAGDLKRGYNPWFYMNRKTLAEVWKLKGSDGHPIWAPVQSGGSTPATIFGFPYDSNWIDLDDHTPTTSNTKPILFGDLRKTYEIYDLQGVVVIRDELTKKREAITEITFRRYLTGKVILPEATRILKIK